MQLGLAVELPPIDAALDSRDAPARIDVNSLHRPEIDHQSAVTDRSTGDVVSSSAYGDFQARFVRETHGVYDVSGSEAPCDERGALVDEAVVNPSSLVVPRVAFGEQAVRQAGDDRRCGVLQRSG